MTQHRSRTQASVKFAPCECSATTEEWIMIESPLDGDDDLGFYRCETCSEMYAFDGTAY